MVDLTFLEDSRANGAAPPPSTLQALQIAPVWLLCQLVPVPGKDKTKKVPYYIDGEPRQGTLDSPADVERLVSYPFAAAALQQKHDAGEMDWCLGFALGQDPETGQFWQGMDFDGRMDGIDTAPGYVEISPSGKGYHVIGRGARFDPYNKGGIEAYCEKRFFSFTGHLRRDGPLADLSVYRNQRIGRAEDRDERSVLEAYAKAKHIPAGECDDMLTRFHGHAARAVKRGYATVLEAALFMGRVNAMAENKDKDWSGKFKRMLEKEGITLTLDVSRYAQFNDGNPIALFGPRATGAGLQYILDNRIVLNEEEQVPEFLLQDMILTGLTTVVGYMGIGKTVSMLSLMMHVAGLMKIPGLPFSIRRKVLYLCEDDAQMRRLLTSWKRAGVITVSLFEVEEWFIPVRVTRRKPQEWKLTIQEFIAREAEAHVGEEWWAVPAVVFDTGAASFDIKRVEDNAEISDLVGHLKDAARLPGWPELTVSILPVLHVPKHQKGSMVEEISAIGAQAWSADTQGTLIFSEDWETKRRLMTLGKKRFETEDDIKQWAIISEKLPAVVLKTKWAGLYPELAEYRSTSRQVVAFKELPSEALAEEKQQAKEAAQQKKDNFEKRRIVKHVEALMLEAQAADGVIGLAFRHGQQGGKVEDPPAGYLVKSIRRDITEKLKMGNKKDQMVQEVMAEVFTCEKVTGFILCSGTVFGMGGGKG